MNTRTKLGISTLVLLALLIFASHLLTDSSLKGEKVLGLSFNLAKSFSFEFSDNRLKKIIENDLRESDGTFAIVAESLLDGEGYRFNDFEPFPAASLYKLILMAAILKEVEEGNLSPEEVIVGDKAHLAEVFGGVDFGYEEVTGRISYSVDEALTRVGRISDNFAAIMLTEKLRSLRLARADDNKILPRMTAELGMTRTDFMGDPITTTASDIAGFFKKLYLREVVSPQVSEQIISYLSLTQLNNRIPARLPEGVKVVHKTGELSGVRHDAGIVELENGPYVIVLLSKEVKYEDEAIELLAKISRDVYEYFKQVAEDGKKR